MYVTRLGIEGLRGAPESMTELQRVVQLPSPPAAAAVADALTLLSIALQPAGLRGLDQLEWSSDPPEVVGDPETGDVQIQGLLPAAVSASLQPDVRAVTVEAELWLDPPLFGRLRAHAVRDPRVVTALGQRPTLSVKVGWLFNGDRSAASPGVLGARVGDVAFDTVGKERPLWLPPLLRDLGERFARTAPFEPAGAVAARLVEASLSALPEQRAGWKAVASALTQPPFSLPAPGLALVGPDCTAVFGEELLRVRQLGRAAWDALRLTEASLLLRPDVLVVDEAVAGPVRDWLTQLPATDTAPIEQVWVP
ncbi:MAG: hypothetical protein KTR31_37465 [Myxococcales bacterium]|nr:hypothetical protein [Myxococcales bacterium]